MIMGGYAVLCIYPDYLRFDLSNYIL